MRSNRYGVSIVESGQVDVYQIILGAVALSLALAGLWWIRRIVKDIEDN